MRIKKNSFDFRHSQRRAEERYGVILDWDNYITMCLRLQDGEGIRLRSYERRSSVWWIRYMGNKVRGGILIPDDGIPMVAVFDERNKCIRTFLSPKEWQRKDLDETT